MNLDRDLRDALQPLHGDDPVADAARVLGALGPAPSPGPFGLPKVAWWLGLAALALGLLGGWLGARWAPPAAPPAKSTESPPDAPKPEPKDRPKDSMQDWGRMSKDLAAVMDFTAFGAITIDEPGEGRQQLKQGGFRARVGTVFTTNDGLAGIYLWANDARVRLGRKTVATVEPQMIALTTGRLWLCDVPRPALVRVRTDLAIVEVDTATALVERTATGLWVCSLEGPVVVRTTAGEAVQLGAMQQVEVDAARGPGAVTKVPFMGSLTSWMTQMILLQQDPDELYERIDYLVGSWLDGAHRDAASVELRRLGSHAVPRLYDALDKVAADTVLVHRTVALLTDLVEYSQKDWLFALLERDDAEVRAVTFRALVRVAGEPVETEAFWRMAPASERDAALQKWRIR